VTLTLSGEYYELLKKRALNALKLAKTAFSYRDYDSTAREAEYAAQLYVKAVIYRVTGEEVRGHNIRSLLGYLASVLFENDFEELAHEITDFTRRKRRILAELEEAHTRAAYSPFEYNKKEAEALINATKELIEALRKIERKLFG